MDSGSERPPTPAWERARTLMAMQDTVWDPGSRRLITNLGIRPGWECLEVGAGAGGIARWMAEQVGSEGRVVATDIDPARAALLGSPGVEPWEHDLTSDPIPEATFDFVHCRFLLMRLPGRLTALAHLANALKPGGWLLVEEADDVSKVGHGAASDRALLGSYNDAMRRALALAGADFQYGRRLPADVDALGFDEVGAEARAFPATAETRALFQLSAEHWRDRLVATGLISPEDADRAPKVLGDPNFHYFGPLCVAVWARAPLS